MSNGLDYLPRRVPPRLPDYVPRRSSAVGDLLSGRVLSGNVGKPFSGLSGMNATTVSAVLCFILLGIAILSGNWSVKKITDSAGVRMGLWELCSDFRKTPFGDLDSCVDLPMKNYEGFPKNAYLACRWMSLIALLILALALMGANVPLWNVRRAVMFMLAGLLCIISSIVWATKLREVKPPLGDAKVSFELGPSWYINLVVGVILVIMAVASKFE